MHTFDRFLNLKFHNEVTFPKNLPLILKQNASLTPDLTLQASKNEIGSYEYFSYKLVYRYVLDLACALQNFGIQKGDLVGLISDNRREWLVTDFAILSLGAADIPRGCDSMGTEIRFILGFTNCKVCFFENERQLDKVLENIKEVPDLKDAILFDSPSDLTLERAALLGIRVHKYIDFEDEGKKCSDSQRDAISKNIDTIEGSDLATIIFTSGTTGTPKGVMLTHDNFISQCEAVTKVLYNAKPGDMWLSIMPVWHVFERAVDYFIVTLKSGIAYSKPAVSIMQEDIDVIKPQWMAGVPRIWDAFMQTYYRKEHRKNTFAQTVFSVSMKIGKLFCWTRDRIFGLVSTRKTRYRLLDIFAFFIPFLLLSPFAGLSYLFSFRKIKASFGGKLNAIFSGGGSLQPETELFFRACGITILDCYGMTETAPFLAMRNPKKPRTCCIGQVFPSAEVIIVPQKDGIPLSSTPLQPNKKGLIFARGRQIMKGYYKRPDLTQQIINTDGYLNTGDVGFLSKHNEITMTGRVKDTIVLLGGENIEPLLIENTISRSKYIESSVIVGQDQRYIGALIVPIKDRILQYANDNNIMYGSYASLLESNEINNLIKEEIDSLLDEKTGFRTCERIGRFVLLPESFKIGREINAKQTVMRHKIEKLYAKEIKIIFSKKSLSV